jgi:hypothetical protein
VVCGTLDCAQDRVVRHARCRAGQLRPHRNGLVAQLARRPEVEEAAGNRPPVVDANIPQPQEQGVMLSAQIISSS